MRIVFAGTPEFAVPALEALAASPHELVGVLTQPDRPAGRGRVLAASAVKQRALALGLPVDQPERLATPEQRAVLDSWQPELLVVVAYGLILPTAVLRLPRHGCLNIHASLLPRWRGAAPIQRAILAGDAETGVDIMQLEATLDTGPIYAETRLAIGPEETAGELQQRLAQAGAAALLPVIAALADGSARPRAQSDVGVCYAAKLRKDEALIDWRRGAVEIARQVRAFNPWPVAETTLGAERLRIWKAHVLPADSAGATAAPGTVLAAPADVLPVATGAGVLAIEVLQLPGKRPVSAGEFRRARAATGQVLGGAAT